MEAFLTGALGHVGGAVADAFLRAGHSVTALVRSPGRARQAEARGLRPVLGDLRDPAAYQAEAARHEIIVHAGFEYDAAGAEVRDTDRTAAAALLRAAEAGGGQVLYTSSAYLLGNLGAHPVDEDADTALAPASSQWRLEVERAVVAAGGAVVRPGLVYGGRGGTMPQLFGGADGAVPFHGDGANRWTLVYRGDLAALYLRIAERRARGIFHGVDGTPLPVRQVAGAASRAAGWQGRTRSIPLGTGPVDEHVERALVRDVAVVPRRSRELGWVPVYPSFTDGAPQAFAEWSQP